MFYVVSLLTLDSGPAPAPVPSLSNARRSHRLAGISHVVHLVPDSYLGVPHSGLCRGGQQVCALMP